MRNLLWFVIVVQSLWFTFPQTSISFALPRARITIAVVDENNRPLEGAKVQFAFEKNTGWGIKEIPVQGRTSTEGLFTGSAFAMGHVGFAAEKDGYYKSVGAYDFHSRKFGRWVPWNPEISVVLRSIENPVSMYARDLEVAPIELPVGEGTVGFDLVQCDWLAPHGDGKTADFLFSLTNTTGSGGITESKLTISFTNRLDGIQKVTDDRRYGSVFKLPRFAPADGYQTQLVHSVRDVPGQPLRFSFAEDNNYIFRIRSEEKEGQVVRAMYGKIHGDIKFDPQGSGTALVAFRYYLNPDYTRNLEFDPTRNLFKDLKRSERVGIR